MNKSYSNEMWSYLYNFTIYSVALCQKMLLDIAYLIAYLPHFIFDFLSGTRQTFE